MATAMRLLVFVATAYIVSVAILWAFQARFIYPAPQTRAPLTSGYEEIALDTSDGLRLRAFYREARDGLPTVLYFHGNGGTLAGASVSNGALAEAGIGVLLLEYRGYGGNPGSPSEEGFYRDGEAAVAWLGEQGLNPDQLVFIGNSIGAGVATEMAARHDPAALVLVAPFTSLAEVAQANLWWMPARLMLRERYDNAAKVSGLPMPVLIQHGTADDLVPARFGRVLAERAAQGRFQAFEGSGHDLSFERRSHEARRDWILERFGSAQ